MPKDAIWRAMSEPGKQYAIYLHHSILRGTAKNYVPVLPGKYQHDLVFRLPAGTYQAEWVEPASGKVIRTDRLSSQNDEQVLATPPYTVDIALRIKRTGKANAAGKSP